MPDAGGVLGWIGHPIPIINETGLVFEPQSLRSKHDIYVLSIRCASVFLYSPTNTSLLLGSGCPLIDRWEQKQ